MKVPHLNLNQPLALGALAILALVGGTDIASAQTSPNRITVQRASVSEGGSNVGGSEDHFAQIDPWADGIVDVLSEQEQIAVQAFAAGGNTLLAISHYKNGLIQVLQTANQPQYRLSWTYKVAERALNLANALENSARAAASIENRDVNDKDLKPIMTMLQSAYENIEVYYYTLDVPYYTPYRMHCAGNRAPQYDLAKFEDQLRSYSVKQINWFKEKFVRSTDTQGTIPLHSSKVFLITLSSVARGLAIDLGSDVNNPNPSLFPTAYAQAARSLAKLSENIDQYLAGTGIYMNDQMAVNLTYTRLVYVLGLVETIGNRNK